MSHSNLVNQSIAASSKAGGRNSDRPVPVAGKAPVRRPTWFQKMFTGTGLFFTISATLLIVGWEFPTHRYLTPQRGVGYALGIIGGSLMLLLLLYPARKRLRWLSFMGSIKGWFHTHMLLGIAGPILILYHSNFSTGAVNSNVALFCMLTVSASGLVGRYMYTRIHHGLTERATTLKELQDNAERLRSVSLSVSFMPELIERMLVEERGILAQVAKCPVLLRPPCAFFVCLFARYRLNAYVRRALRVAAKQSTVLAKQKNRLFKTASGYVKQRIEATREVSEFQAYSQLFSLWHVLHLPLFFMLLVAGIVHVIAVHVY